MGASFLSIALGQALGASALGILIEQAGHRTGFLALTAVGLVGAAIRPATHRSPPVGAAPLDDERTIS